jgi:aminoglycoside phosphotransferase (APT) family kinase protein
MTTVGLAGVGVEPVTDWIAGLGLGARAPLTFARVGNGLSNLTYLATDAAGQQWVLRRRPVGPSLPSTHDVAREYRVLSALEGTGVPVPRPLGFTDDPAVTDAPLLLMSYVDGLVVDDVAVGQRLDPGVRAELGRALARTLATVHAVDIEARGLGTLASHEPYAARQIKRWRRQWAASQTRDLPIVAAIGNSLEAALPEQRELTLVHGDYHLLNVIAAPDGTRIQAILDWELCTLGDPLADVGTLFAYWPRPGDIGKGPFPISCLPGFPERAELAEIYAAQTGRDLAALPFWHVLGLWKVAIIGEGVRRRALDRGVAPGTGVLATDFVEELLAQAELVAEQAGL